MKLKHIANITMGSSPKSKNIIYDRNEIAFLQGNRTFNYRVPDIDTFTDKPTKVITERSILFSVRAPVGDVNIIDQTVCIGRGIASIAVKEDTYLEYLFYYLKRYDFSSINKGTGTIYGSINRDFLENFDINLPTLNVQKEIADKISVYDDKIENNNKIIELLEEKASLLYKRYFVDFEFPNEEGLPYKSSGGKFKESEVGEIPVEWDCKMIEEYTNVVTGKKNANAAVEGGEYKFFTCSKNDFLTDEYSFDGNAILIAGNGDFSVKRYNGKFDAYQRTYVLMPPKNDVDWLFWHLKINLNEITSGHRGSVIKFITKSMLTDSKILECYDNNIKEKFYNINEYILSMNKENILLEEKRDLLIKELIK